MIPLVLFLILASSVLGQQALYVDLTGSWRFTTQNNPAMAQPDFDDSSWETMQLPPLALQGAAIWLRRTVELPQWVDRSQLALTLGPFRRIYAVYINGVEIEKVGSFDTQSDSQIARTRTFFIPPAVAAGNNTLVIAIRTGRSGGTPPSWKLDQKVPYSLTYRAQAPIDAGAVSLAIQRERLTPTLVIAFAYLIFCIPILLAWLGDRQRHELPWLAAFLIATSILDANRVWSLTLESTPFGPEGGPWLYAFTKSTTWVLSTTFVIVFLRFRLYWVQVLLWLGWLTFLGLLIFPQFIPVKVGWFSFYLAFGSLSGVVSAVVISVAWKMLWNERPPLSRHLLLSVLMLLSLERIVWGSTSGYEASFQFGGYQFELIDLLSLVLTSVMLVLLLRQIVIDRRDRQRLQGEMLAGRDAQLFLLGSGSIIHTANFEVDPVYEPAAEVGGDFHWTRIEPDSSLILVVGDVSGKGLKAAMLVSVAIGILRNEKSAAPAAILAALNQGLTGHTGGGFVTCCCARFDSDGTVTIANAGHPSPYSESREVEVEAGLPLGIVAAVVYDESVVKGSRFTFVSDGVVEAENPRRELFGFDRTQEISGKSAQEIADAAKAWGQNDDITVVTVRRNA